jgi:hypothetical protein
MDLPSLHEIRQSIAGALRLLRHDAGALSLFNLTDDGFWRSFFALVLVLPMMMVVDVVFTTSDTVPLAAKLSRSSVNLVLHWMLFAAIALPLCIAAGLERRYKTFITVYNWASIVVIGLLLVPAILVLSGVLTIEGGQFIVTATSIYVIFYLWFVVKTALESNGWIAAGFVLLDFVLNVTVDGFLGLR